MKVFNVMTSNLVAAREGSTTREIGTKLLIGNFNGLPIIDSNIKVIGIVTAVDILRAIRQGKNLDSIRAIDIMTRNPVVVKQDTEINEVIDIILQKAIILVPVINDELRQNLIEKFLTIGKKASEQLKTFHKKSFYLTCQCVMRVFGRRLLKCQTS